MMMNECFTSSLHQLLDRRGQVHSLCQNSQKEMKNSFKWLTSLSVIGVFMLLCVNQFILLLISNRKSFSNDYVCDYGNQSRDLLLGTSIIDGQVQDYELELKRMINIVEPLVRILFNNVRYTKKRTINERESPNDEARSNRHRSKHRILVLVGDVNNRQGYSASNVVGGYCWEKKRSLGRFVDPLFCPSAYWCPFHTLFPYLCPQRLALLVQRLLLLQLLRRQQTNKAWKKKKKSWLQAIQQ